MIGGPFVAAVSCIILTAAFNTCPFAILSDCRRQVSSLLSGVSATAMTMLSLKPSTVFTRPRSSIGVDLDESSRMLSLPLSNGSTGSTPVVFWSPLATFRQPKPRRDNAPCWTSQPWPYNLNQTASGKPGAFQADIRVGGPMAHKHEWGPCGLALFAGLHSQLAARLVNWQFPIRRVISLRSFDFAGKTSRCCDRRLVR